jgi:hypothetical protein
LWTVTIHRKPQNWGDCHEERRPRSFIESGGVVVFVGDAAEAVSSADV